MSYEFNVENFVKNVVSDALSSTATTTIVPKNAIIVKGNNNVVFGNPKNNETEDFYEDSFEFKNPVRPKAVKKQSVEVANMQKMFNMMLKMLNTMMRIMMHNFYGVNQNDTDNNPYLTQFAKPKCKNTDDSVNQGIANAEREAKIKAAIDAISAEPEAPTTERETAPAPAQEEAPETETTPEPVVVETKPAAPETETTPAPAVVETKPVAPEVKATPAPAQATSSASASASASASVTVVVAPKSDKTETKTAPAPVAVETKPVAPEVKTIPAPVAVETKPAEPEVKAEPVPVQEKAPEVKAETVPAPAQATSSASASASVTVVVAPKSDKIETEITPAPVVVDKKPSEPVEEPEDEIAEPQAPALTEEEKTKDAELLRNISINIEPSHDALGRTVNHYDDLKNVIKNADAQSLYRVFSEHSDSLLKRIDKEHEGCFGFDDDIYTALAEKLGQARRENLQKAGQLTPAASLDNPNHPMAKENQLRTNIQNALVDNDTKGLMERCIDNTSGKDEHWYQRNIINGLLGKSFLYE